ncbi:MAG: caspase family protein, partial [Rhodospirillales bacterium]|nr:caspase family protein [Rhodospirillales bacterium]
MLVAAAAVVIGISPAAAAANQLAAAPSDIPAGKWVGLVIAADDAKCRFKDSRPIVAKTADGHVTFMWGPSNNETVLKGAIGADGGVNVSAPMAGRDNEFTITGKFSGGTFAGEFAVSKTRCFGKVTVNAAEQATASVAARRDVGKTPQAKSAAADEAKLWQEIQHSTNVSDFITYLQKYPNGIFVPLAESQMRALIARQGTPAVPSPQDALAGIEFGRYHALVIGINNYAHLPKLKTAVNDAKAVAALLERDHGFKVQLLIDPSRTAIVDVF